MFFVVHGLNLERYLFNSLLVPHIIDDEGNTIINHVYAKFTQQDRSLASWLLA